jgi:uncharacterized membrane protein
MKKNLIFLPVSLPFFIFLLGLPFLLLAVLSLLEASPGPLLRRALGLSVLESVALYLTILLASVFNVPVYSFKSRRDSEQKYASYLGGKYPLPVWHGHNTVVSINLGGCVVSAMASGYFAFAILSQWPAIALSIVIVSLGVFLVSKPSRSLGFYVPFYVPPLLSLAVALAALYTTGGGLYNCARLAFIASVFGTIAGTSLLNTPRLRLLGTGFVSVGGYGSFDGIFLSGVLGTIVACIFASI